MLEVAVTRPLGSVFGLATPDYYKSLGEGLKLYNDPTPLNEMRTVGSKHQVSIDGTVGWAAFPVHIKSPFNSWSNLSKISYSRRHQQHQSGIIRNQTGNLLINRLVP